MQQEKQAVHDFWDDASCGEDLYLEGDDAEAYAAQARERYELEPFILDFADFASAGGKTVLEIGVGLGADHQRYAEAGATLYGIDLTERAVQHTRHRFEQLGLSSDLRVGDAEALPFDDDTFDVVYSWGVLHHTPNTATAIEDVRRVTRPGGDVRVMMYHKRSFVGLMLWVRYALLRLRPFTSMDTIFDRYMESPGTQAFTVAEAEALFADFSEVEVDTVLSHGDLLTSSAGQRHKGPLIRLARRVWPRAIIRRLFPKYGLFMLISAVK